MTAVLSPMPWRTAVATQISQSNLAHRAAQDSLSQIQDSLANRLLDSVVVRSPLPDPLVPIVQWIFQRPSWVMITGIVVGGLVALAVLVLLWRYRRAIGHWLVTRDRGVKLALGGGVAAILLLAVAVGWKANHYMMHDNNFCRGCHIFVPSGQAFVRPDTGTYLLVNALEGKHDTLQCHACHAFEIKAQTKELFYWIIERPDKIPPHAKVPRQVCERCHVQGAARQSWQRIASTAGHRVHLESDSLRQRGIACLTCHARSAHRFQPADSTCAQQGCHLTSQITIKLGKMADQTGMHCILCHRFTADVPLLATRDSAAGTLTPAMRQCFGCHEMRARLADFDPARDPHGGTCGLCHNPHLQVRPADALKSCTNANCHADWRTVPFHTGAAHRAVATRCQTCHQPHSARVDASDCTGCHTAVRNRSGGRLRPPLPFDTLKALRGEHALLNPTPTPGPDEERPKGKGDAPPADDRPAAWTDPAVVSPSDTFSHERHRKLACLTCHEPSAPKNRLVFERPRGCQICHHQQPAQSRCVTCHTGNELAAAIPDTIAVTVAGHQPRPRATRFQHGTHAALRCVECHTTPVTLAPAEPVTRCTNCHEQHHTAGRDCATCHRFDQILAAHAETADPHEACTRCHAPATVARLTPTRSFCLACHGAKVDHYAPKECTVCHLQTTPEAWRVRLTARETTP